MEKIVGNSKMTLGILFYIKKGKIKKNGLASIMTRITVNGEQSVFSSQIDVDPKHWNVKLNRVASKSADAQRVNTYLNGLYSALYDTYRVLTEEEGVKVTSEMVKSKFFVKDIRSSSVMEVFDILIADKEKLSKENLLDSDTTRKYRRAKYIFAEFMRSKYRTSDISFGELNLGLIQDFEIYLKTHMKMKHNSAIKNYIKYLRAAVIYAHNHGYTNNNPFLVYNDRLEKVDRGYLTAKELEKLLSHKIENERLNRVRDIFAFSCFTGLAYADVANLTTDNIRELSDGGYWIITKRQKTKIDVQVPLLEIPKDLIKKYDGQGKSGRLMPILSNQKMNAYLKEIGAICGIEKDLTFHLARHTFATTVTLLNGVPIESVSKMLGHTNIQTTQIYARVTNTKIEKDMAGIPGKLTDYVKAIAKSKQLMA